MRDLLKLLSVALTSMLMVCSANAEDEKPVAAPVQPDYSKMVFTPEVFTRETGVTFADVPKPYASVTRHKTRIKGRKLAYTAEAAGTYITNFANEPIANIFSFSYLLDGGDKARPVLFVFNGGPGSSSVWLHMGAIGPKRVVLDNEVNPTNTPPFGVRDNPISVLDVADLVFIDPVGTGFSQAVGKATNQDFAGIDADAEAIARFIELWLTRHGRWNSPKYILGESYGSVRAAVLPRTLLGGPTYTGVMRGITLDGVIMLGTTLNMGMESAAKGDAPDPSAGLYLPSLAATAWYHDKVDRKGMSVAEFHEEVRQFAEGEYAQTVYELQKQTLGEGSPVALSKKLESYTAIPATEWRKNGLQFSSRAYLKTLLAEEGLEAGAYDSRYTLPLAASGGEPVADDPAMGRYVPGFMAAFHDMVTSDLKVDLQVPYYAINWATMGLKWNFERTGVEWPGNFADELAVSMRRTPKMRVMVASGYYDMVTTAAAAMYQVRSALPMDRVDIYNYASGHMLYLGDTAEAFTDDLRGFLAE